MLFRSESGLAGALSSFFLWLAENIGTLTGTWVYAGKHISSFANLSKMGSWYLLLYVAFIQVTFVVRPRSDELAGEGNESNHADREQCVETGPAGPAQHRGGAFPTPIEAAQVSHDGGGGALGPHPVDHVGQFGGQGHRRGIDQKSHITAQICRHKPRGAGEPGNET